VRLGRISRPHLPHAPRRGIGLAALLAWACAAVPRARAALNRRTHAGGLSAHADGQCTAPARRRHICTGIALAAAAAGRLARRGGAAHEGSGWMGGGAARTSARPRTRKKHECSASPSRKTTCVLPGRPAQPGRAGAAKCEPADGSRRIYVQRAACSEDKVRRARHTQRTTCMAHATCNIR
jgi:hypothetical protein